MATRHCDLTPLARRSGEEKFHRGRCKAKILQNDVLENRPFDSRLSLTKQQANAREHGSREEAVR